MRGTFAKTLATIAARDSRVVFLTADLGFMALEPVIEAAGSRFFNAGVAEQNMIGVATGLAEGGLFPFTYSIATFASLRPFEFIRNGPVLNNVPVRIVGVGAGFEYGTAGPTHHGVDDAGALRSLGITVISPADFRQTKTVVEELYDAPFPYYLRLGKDDVHEVAGLDGRFRLGRADVVRDGTSDVVIFAMGSISLEVASACEDLAAAGVSPTLAIVSTFNPAPVEDITNLVRQHARAVTVEAHNVDGGLGSVVAEAIAEAGIATKLTRLGIRGGDAAHTGSQGFYQRLHGLDRASIVASVLRVSSKAAI